VSVLYVESKANTRRRWHLRVKTAELTSGHSTQNAFIFIAYNQPAKLSLNVPSASWSSFSFSTFPASVVASSERSISAGDKKSSPDGEVC